MDAEQLRVWIEDELRTQQWVADRLGVCRQTISKWCQRYGVRAQRTGPRSGPGHPNWAGGRLIDKDGYVLVYCPGHPAARAPRRSYVLEHRLVMEAHLGRSLGPEEVVHHRNRDKQDNRLENLSLYHSNADHLRDELTGKVPAWSQAGRQAILEGARRVPTDQQRARMSIAQSGRPRVSEQTREKMRASARRAAAGRRRDDKGRFV